MSKKVIRNIPTASMLLLLAQANKIGCPYIDLYFDSKEGAVYIQPITPEAFTKRFEQDDMKGNEGGQINLEDLNEDS